jgi:hypothetical protein
MGRREVLRIGRREVAHMGTHREAAHMAASWDPIRSRHRAVAGRGQHPEPHNLAHKMKRAWRPSRQIRK